MILFLTISLFVAFLLIWGAYSRLMDAETRLLKLEHPEFFRDDTLFASYLGKADD